MLIPVVIRNIILIAFIAVALLTEGQLHAQNPGYIGKHLSVYAMYDASFALRDNDGIRNYDEYNVEPTVSALGVELTPGMGIEYTFSTALTAGLNTRFVNSETAINAFYEGSSVRDLQAYCGEAISRGFFAGFYVKYYRHEKKGMIAPIGRYHLFELIVGRTEFVTGNVYSQNRELLTDIIRDEFMRPYQMLDNIEELELPGFRQSFVRYAFGSETVMANRIPLDVAFQITLPASIFSGFTLPNYPEHDENIYSKLLFTSYSAMFLGITTKVGLFVN